MTKCYAQRKDVFDINKVTVVGSPTITEYGVASGLQANNYLYTPLFNLSELTEIEFDYDITTKEQTGSVYLCGLKDTALSLYISSTGYMRLLFESTYSTAIIPSTAYNVGKLHFRFVINPISLKAFVYVFQNGNKIGEMDIAISSGVLITRHFIFGADYFGNYGYALNGSIDLKSIKVIQEGTVYSPTKPTYLLERRKEGYDPSKFTVVGSPTITSDGVLSNCYIGGNSVKTAKPITLGTGSWEIKLELTTQDLTTSTTSYFLGGDVASIVYGIQPSGLSTLFIGNQGSSWDVINRAHGKYVFQSNTEYYFKIGFTGTQYYVMVSTDGNYVDDLRIDNTNIIYQGDYVRFGNSESNGNTNVPVAVSINLPSISITVDGVEVFTGAKEKFYAMRGGK